MVNDLRELMRENVAAAPPDHVDLTHVLDAGRRRVRTRRAGAVGVAALATAAVVTAGAALLPTGSHQVGAAGRPPAPDAPVLRLDQAQAAAEGQDYRVVASHTNEDLDADNGRYLEGVTDDGLVLFRDGARNANGWQQSFALLDPDSGEKDWLPDPGVGQLQVWPVELSRDRLVLLAGDGPAERRLVAYVFDRDSRSWSTVRWPGLPRVDYAQGEVAPDGRLYVRTPATQGAIPEGGWPKQPDGDAEDAGAEGGTFHLWSVSLGNGSDVVDEGLVVGEVAFTDTAMVWTDGTASTEGLVHVRDLTTRAEHSFDPGLGERCNLLSLTAGQDRIVMSQYCGTYDGGVRDDRVQIVSTDGDQIVTLQDSGVSGGIADPGSELVSITANAGSGTDGTYVYDLAADRLLRVSDSVSGYSMGGGPMAPDQVMWQTPVEGGHGATQWLAEWVG